MIPVKKKQTGTNKVIKTINSINAVRTLESRNSGGPRNVSDISSTL